MVEFSLGYLVERREFCIAETISWEGYFKNNPKVIKGIMIIIIIFICSI